MENKKKECYRCKYLDRYYTKGIKEYQKTRFGWCCKKQESVTIHNGCENFFAKPKQTRNMRLLRFCLNDLLTEISEIRKIIEAENGENKEL